MGGSPGNYAAFSWAKVQYYQAAAPPWPLWHGDVPYHDKTLVDDTVLVEARLGVRPEMSMWWAERTLKQVFGPAAINEAKRGEEGSFAPTSVIWGVTYDTTQDTVAYPEPKITKLWHVMHEAELDPGCRRVSVRTVQRVCGNLQPASVACTALQPELGAIYHMLSRADGSCNHVTPRGSETEVQRAWEEWDETVTAVRLLIAVPEAWTAHFNSGLRTMLTVAERLAIPGEWKRARWAWGTAPWRRLA